MMATKPSSHHSFEQKGPLDISRFIARLCDLTHVMAVKNLHSRPLCGTDHYCRPDFHFEVENNSLQTFLPAG
ncbi:hypothetical protein HMPREF0201_00214 [Cedecea davisae DSM 4568]|uniref:Uncharacterized protein n=1 Tax=Cedecea davisae DSM 4568 TaxID=566551 RepID=S3JJZ6_9ENTR|nr:hypothetical protein HMPREF0201_00214 [Cedecea davisae DSM 4568]